VLVIAAYYVGHALSVGANLILLAGAFLISIISYGLIENPVRRATLRRPIRTSAVLWATSVGLVVLVAGFNLRSIADKTALSEAAAGEPIPTLAPFSPTPGVSATPGTTESATEAIPAVVAAVQAARRGEPIPASLVPPAHQVLGDRYEFPSKNCYAKSGMPNIRKICPLGAVGATRTIVVFGDSHARQWMPSILWMASQDGWTVVPLIELGCRPSVYATGCSEYFQWAVQQMEILHPDVILIGGHLQIFSPEVMQQAVAGIGLLVDTVRPLAPNVIVIGDPPVQGQEPVDCLLARDSTLKTCTRTLSKDQSSLIARAARAARNHGAAFLDTIGWFCFENQCPMVVGHTVAYRDGDHITVTYALELRELFRDAFARALTE
jgi:hypothetical protein